MAATFIVGLVLLVGGCAASGNDVVVPVARSLAPDPPQGFAVSDRELRQVTVTWTPPAAAEGSYRIERAESPQGPFKTIARASPRRGSFVDKAELRDTTTYFYRLVPVTGSGAEGSPSKVLESMTAPPPDPPRNLEAAAPASRAVSIAWSPPASEGVVKYRVERAAAGAPDAFSERGVVEKCSFAEGGKAGSDLLDSTRYLYRVTAINRVGVAGKPSAPVEVVTQPPPAPVKGLEARSGEVRCVPLSWQPSPESDVTRYDVYRTDAGGGAPVRVATLKGRDWTTWLDGGADPGSLPDAATFRYNVRAFNAVGGWSELSAPVDATTRAVPPAVENVHARSGEPRAVTVIWTPSPDEKVAGYAIGRAGGPDGAFAEVVELKGRSTTSWIDRGGVKRPEGPGGLKDGAAYRFRVVAFNTARARSPWSAEASAWTKAAPAAPSGLGAATNRPASVVLWWNANRESDIVAYVVESRGSGSSRWREVARVPPTAGTVAASETKLGNGERRLYRVKAIDADTLESPWSNEVPGASKPAPDAPAGLQTAWLEGSAVLTWQAPPQPDITSYQVWKKGRMSSTPIGTTTACRLTLGPAAVGTRMSVQVSALDADGLESERTAPFELRHP
jgi:fibronectin type 3 domain-containing protein